MKTKDLLYERIKYACTHKDGAYLNSPNMLAIKQAYETIINMEKELRIYRLKDICFPGSYPDSIINEKYITEMDDVIYDSLYTVLNKYNSHDNFCDREYNYKRNRYIIKKYVSLYKYVNTVIDIDVENLTYNKMLDSFMEQYPHKATEIQKEYRESILLDDISDKDTVRAEQIEKWCSVLEKMNFNKQFKKPERKLNIKMIR